jgi:cell wall-associated NlpC family hydrolase
MDLDALHDLDAARRDGRSLLAVIRGQPRSVQVGAVVVGVVLLVLSLLDTASPASTPAPMRPPSTHASLPPLATDVAQVPTGAATVVAVEAAPPSVTVPGPAGPAGAVMFALAQVGKPYRFGTSGPESFDCSGLTRAAYLQVGVDLPHRASWQAEQGAPVEWRIEPIVGGDLVFTRGGRPIQDLGHVGMAVSATEWVVAPAPGREVERAPIPFAAVQRVRRVVS